MDILDMIASTAAADASAAAKHAAPLPSLVDTMGRISPLKWLHLRFVCGVTRDVEVTTICEEVAADPIKQDGLAFLYQYLLTGMEL